MAEQLMKKGKINRINNLKSSVIYCIVKLNIRADANKNEFGRILADNYRFLRKGCKSMKYNLIEYSSFLHEKGHYVLPQEHSGIEIVYYVDGSGLTTINGDSYSFRPGDVAIIPPDTTHDELFQEDGCVLFCIIDYENLNMDLIKERVISGKTHTTKMIYETMNRIILESLLEDQKYCELIDTMLYELLLQIYRLCEEAENENATVEQVKKYLKLMYSHPINFLSLSEKLGYSYDRLRHIFNENTGISMKQYLTNVRIGHAQRLLTEKNYTVEQISKMCGYGNVSNFIVAFRKKIQVTPIQYRKAIASNNEKTLNF